MERTAIADPQAEGGDLRSIDINARGIGLGRRLDAITGQQLDQAAFDPGDQITHTKPEPAHIKQQVSHQLARTVIGHLAAPVGLHYWNIAGHQQVLGLARLALGEHRRVLHQPDLVASFGAALVGEPAHGLEHRLVRQ
ncbi:hypothetical protein D3C80_1528840 [compost metagenome]